MQITTEVTITRGTIIDRTSVVVETDGYDEREPVIDATTDDVEVALSLAVADAKMIYIVSDQDVLLETNSGSAADDSFNLTAGQEMFWRDGSGVVCPFTTDVTAFFFSNAGDVDANVVIRIAKDATP